MNIFYKFLIFICLFYPGILLYFQGFDDAQKYHEIIPNWVHNLEKNQLLRNISIENQPIFKRHYFFNKKNLIYYNSQGEALHKIHIDSQTLIFPDNDLYLVSPRLGNKVDLFNNRGEKQWSLNTYAIPNITSFRKNIFFISSDHNTLSVYDYNRNQILPPTYLGSLITDYDVCDNNDAILIGTIEGDLYLFDFQMKQVFKKKFQDSQYNYLKSVTCSSSGEKILALDGLYPEWLTLFDNNGEILWRYKTEYDRRTKTDIFIDEDNGLILDIEKRAINIFNIKEGEKVGSIQLTPEIRETMRVVFDSHPGWLLLGINGKRANKVLLLNREFKTVWENNITGEYLTYVELLQSENKMFFIFHTVSSIYSYQFIFN